MTRRWSKGIGKYGSRITLYNFACLMLDPSIKLLYRTTPNVQVLLWILLLLIGKLPNRAMCPLALENNLRIIGTAPRNNCIVTPPLMANYNLEWYHYSKKGNTNAKRTVLVRGDLMTV